jgi:hypothetical protein
MADNNEKTMNNETLITRIFIADYPVFLCALSASVAKI